MMLIAFPLTLKIVVLLARTVCDMLARLVGHMVHIKYRLLRINESESDIVYKILFNKYE